MSKNFDHGGLDGMDYRPTSKSNGKYVSCFESHPRLKLGGGVFVGGSCSRPVLHDADVYIGFDHNMTVRQTLPWESGQAIQLLYPITDMHAPSDGKEFIKLIDWSIKMLAEGKTVHAGCIGGHGRTGTYLAALWSVVNNEKDVIQAVRNAYCKKAVESRSQVDFLHKHFGIVKVEGAKEALFSGWSSSSKTKSMGATSYFPTKTGGKEWKPSSTQTQMFKDAQQVFNPIQSSDCIWDRVF